MNFDIDKQGQAIIRGDFFDQIREHFSEENNAAKFQRGYGGFIQRRNYAITPTGRCDPGLIPEIVKYLAASSYTSKIYCSDNLTNIIRPSKNWSHNFTTEPYPLNLKLREYQSNIVQRCLISGRGTVVLATAGGKTLTVASLVSRITTFYDNNLKGLIIVPDRGLVEQTFNDFVEYNVPFSFSKWTGDDLLDLSTDVIIANLGILQSSKTDLTWINYIDLLIVDEVHKIRRGNKVNKIIKKIKTPHKYGFTGTMPEDKLDQWNIIGKIGPVLYEKNSYELRVEGYVANAKVLKLKLNHKTRLYRSSDINPYRQELDYLIGSEFRNNTIAKLANNADNNILIMVDYIKHGENLYDVCKKICNNKQVYFIQGEVQVDEREKVKQLVEQNTNVVVIAISKIFSTGINIKNLHYIAFAGGGKAKIKIIQSIGRGLRLHESKKRLVIVDISDNFKYSMEHSWRRDILYERERIQVHKKEISE